MEEAKKGIMVWRDITMHDGWVSFGARKFEGI